MSAMTDNMHRLCSLDELSEGSSKGFSIETRSGHQELFLVRKNGRLFSYCNSCPHTGGPLDWVPDQFLNLDGDLIQCATHDALFRIEDGLCVAGPCAGMALIPVSITISENEIFAVADE